MNKHINRVYYLFCLVIGFSFHTEAQVSDSLQSVKFAEFLEKSKLYEYAAEEYEMLYFKYPGNKELFKRLLRNHRLSGNNDYLLQRFQENTGDSIAITYYAISLIENNQFNQLGALLPNAKNNLNQSIFNRLSLDHTFALGKYNKALELYNTYQVTDQNYLQLITKGQNLTFKSPALAAIMSGIIPGAGRVYAKDYANAIISMIFIGSAGYQAYRRFSKNGISSPTGWIYGGVSLGFYLGNIYGSYQAAKFYNQKKRDALNAQFKSHIDLYYSQY